MAFGDDCADMGMLRMCGSRLPNQGEGSRMENRIKHAAERWGLSHCEEIYRYPSKAVFSGFSERFGAVILKIDENERQLRSEYQMLSRLSGRLVCKVYAYDGTAGLLLEERIVPGTVLRREPSLEKRVRIFSRIFREIHVPAREGETYLDWLEGICDYCVRNHVSEELLNLAASAREICAEMFRRYPDRALLHGDLHHDNLLERADGTYAVIDPKGVVGPAILDLPRFILNELDTEHACPDRQHIDEVIRRLGGLTGYPEADIRKLFFMETVLANVWCAEGGEEINRQELEIAAAGMDMGGRGGI